jgi:high-affinity iron transporter
VGAVGLVAIYLLVNQLGVRVAMKPFFAVTGIMLYYMAFVFAGKGIAELQGVGLVPLTVIDGAPRIPVLGIYPTLESLLVQGVLLLLALVALVWALRPKEPSAPSVVASRGTVEQPR